MEKNKILKQRLIDKREYYSKMFAEAIMEKVEKDAHERWLATRTQWDKITDKLFGINNVTG